MVREDISAEGVFGLLTLEDGFKCFTGELPWRSNLVGRSCIPAGTYVFKIVNSPKHGRCYEAENVPGRTDIQIHSANFMGDAEKGFKCELEGCIAPGQMIDSPTGQKQIVSSKRALMNLKEHLKGEPLELTIRWADGVGPVEEQ